MTAQLAPASPLAGSVADVAAGCWLDLRVGWPEESAGWVACSDVGAGFVRSWERSIDAQLLQRHGRSHGLTVSSLALGWYASVPGVVGGAFFRQLNRVPRLDRGALAFARHADEHYPIAAALLDERFWCLPDDPAAADRSATVVPDRDALGAVLRGQIRQHADAALAEWQAGTRLPRRHLLGAFFDGLDTGVWYGGPAQLADAAEVIAATRSALPGQTAEFAESSSVRVLTDARGRDHLARQRVSCCYYYKVTDEGRSCTSCPRTDEPSRTERYAQLS